MLLVVTSQLCSLLIRTGTMARREKFGAPPVLRPCLVHPKFKKFSKISVTSNLAAHAWSIKYRRKQKLITQFYCKSRDKFFDPS